MPVAILHKLCIHIDHPHLQQYVQINLGLIMGLMLVCEVVCVHADLESRELMQAGLWQSSCPSARLIMQERHSRPRSFCLGVKLCPHALRITWPWPPSPLSSLPLFLSLLGVLWMALVVENGDGGVCGGVVAIGGVVERRGMQHCFLSFLHTVVFSPSLPPSLPPQWESSE